MEKVTAKVTDNFRRILANDTGFPYRRIREYFGEAWTIHARSASMTAAEIAKHFVSARQRGQHLAHYPGTAPDTLASAYAVQDAAIAASDRPVIGWKVGRIFPPLSDHFGANRLSGPIFTTTTYSAAQPVIGQVFIGGFGAAEAEFLIKIGSDLPVGKQDYTLEEVERLIAAVHIGIEIASSPLPTINELGPAVTISDFGNNNGLIIGAAIENWQTSNFADWTVTLQIDGSVAGEGAANSFPDGPIGSMRFLLNNLGARGIPIHAGTWISSGAVTGVHQVTPGQSVHATFGPALSVNCTIEAAPII
jgi:2-keto-4-pentenoate hydratase